MSNIEELNRDHNTVDRERMAEEMLGQRWRHWTLEKLARRFEELKDAFTWENIRYEKQLKGELPENKHVEASVRVVRAIRALDKLVTEAQLVSEAYKKFFNVT